MKALVLGATGATGRLAVEELLRRGRSVVAVVRDASRLPGSLRQDSRVRIVESTILRMSDTEVEECVAGCDAVLCCLGHRLSFAGVFGPPRRLVTRTIARVCDAIWLDPNASKTRFVLMGSAGVRNRDLEEPVSFAQRAVIGALRALLPPHADNEDAAEFLRSGVGSPDRAEWVVVRPDGLVDRQATGPYDAHPSPIRSAIFDAGQTSRANVAHFMAELATNERLWAEWRGQMPVIYDREDE